MSGPDPELEEARRHEAARWLSIAAGDADVAALCLETYEPRLSAAAYHCQQAAEKVIKGMLIVAGVHFPKTHDLRALGDLAEVHFPAWRELFARSAPLTAWGYVYHYPGMEEEMPPDEAVIRVAMDLIDGLARQLLGLIAPNGL